MSNTDEAKTWTFLTNHAQVLLCLVQTPDIRLREVAEHVGITERATQRIVAELVEGGYVRAERVGRRNRYTVDRQHARDERLGAAREPQRVHVEMSDRRWRRHRPIMPGVTTIAR